ncbi:uncharacterized protein LOC110998761 [Pieris rapae]|uniref:uncharacterized protein LOC110998761 n=1 Tax=Pieris rapae TaxID=64459 RepID=UPI001E2807CF|nr:uncharacterized protein LOC110998761 [Pieris rapae]
MAKKSMLTPAEKQRRYREKLKKFPEKVAETKRKNLERYHARKKLVADMSIQEHQMKKRIWQERNKRRRMMKKMLEEHAFIRNTTERLFSCMAVIRFTNTESCAMDSVIHVQSTILCKVWREKGSAIQWLYVLQKRTAH